MRKTVAGVTAGIMSVIRGSVQPAPQTIDSIVPASVIQTDVSTVEAPDIISSRIVATDRDIPYTTEKRDDPNLANGEEKVIQSGINGRETVVSEKFTDGLIVDIASSRIEPTPEIIAVGTLVEPDNEVLTPVTPSGDAQVIARQKVAARGWGDSEFSCLVSLWNRESGWRTTAANPSGAYGIPQALPGSKMAAAGADWRTNAATQIEWGLGYISGRYGTPCEALGHSDSVGWY